MMAEDNLPLDRSLLEVSALISQLFWLGEETDMNLKGLMKNGQIAMQLYRMVCVILLFWQCVHHNIDSFYCYEGTMVLSLSSPVVWANYNL